MWAAVPTCYRQCGETALRRCRPGFRRVSRPRDGQTRSFQTQTARLSTHGHQLSSLSEPDPRQYGDIPDAVGSRSSAKAALQNSCYLKLDFKIREDAVVYEAVQRFAAYNIGALAVCNAEGRVAGIISERDYVCKVALLGRNSKVTLVKEVATMGANIIVAKKSDSVHDCMKKMLARDIRHLPVMDDQSGEVIGMLSIKDLIREVDLEKDNLIAKLTDFKLGRGGFFEHT